MQLLRGMKQTFTGLLVVLAFASGCVFVSKEPKHSHESHSHKKCKKHQHWDDGRCVHKGKGKGARKHDD